MLTLTGSWEGKLEYKDYQRPDRRVTLPTLLEVAPSAEPRTLALRFTYDDGPGKIVHSNDLFSLDAQAATLVWGDEKESPQQRQAFAVRHLDDAAEARALTLVAETEGRDDNKPATLRETLVLDGDKLSILKETKVDDAPFAFRHRYEFKRVAGSAQRAPAPGR